MSDDLLPCPFCGSKHSGTPQTGVTLEEVGGGKSRPYCWTCEMEGPSGRQGRNETTEEFVAAWNRRAPVVAEPKGKTAGQLAEARSQRDTLEDEVLGLQAYRDQLLGQLEEARAEIERLRGARRAALEEADGAVRAVASRMREQEAECLARAKYGLATEYNTVAAAVSFAAAAIRALMERE